MTFPGISAGGNANDGSGVAYRQGYSQGHRFCRFGTDSFALSQQEVDQIIYHAEATAEKPKIELTFEHGETVKIIDGPSAISPARLKSWN